MEATQDEVFRRTAMPLLEGILTGYNATIFAYGVSLALMTALAQNLVLQRNRDRHTDVQATGCGKTHTISGTHEDPGVIIRTTAELFRLIEETDDEYDTHIEVSMVEIYNETIRDLLSDDFPACPTGGLRLLENEKNRVTVGGVTLKRPKSVEDVMNLVMMGNSRRSTSFTAMNSQSSRSHAVLQMNIGRSSKGHDIDVAESVVRQCLTSATLSIIDLAGSERAAATQNMGARMKEGANINKSLLALSSCIAALCQRPIRGVRPHVPYRNSKLTRMLKFSLGGNCRTVMIVCVSPSSRDLEDTYNTLIWADKAKNVSTKISRNTAGVDVRSAQYIEALARKETELKDLKATIARMEAGEKSRDNKRRELERADMQRTIADVDKQVQLGKPNILAGGTYRAGWDGAELLIAAMKDKLATLDNQDDIAHLNSVIKQQYARFQTNADAAESMRLGESSQTTVNNVLRNASLRKFGDLADSADLENLRLTIELRRAEMTNNLLETRETAYREAVQRLAIAAVNVMTVLRNIVAGLGAQGDVLTKMAGQGSTAGIGGVIAVLADMSKEARQALDGLFADVAGGDLPPLPTVDRLGSGKASSPNKPFVSPPSTASDYSLQAPRRMPRSPLIPSSSSSSNRPDVRNTPSGKRLLANAAVKAKVASPVLMSPKRRGARWKVASKAALGSPALELPPNKKGVLWAEEDEHKYMSSEDSKSSDWIDEDEEASPVAGAKTSGALSAPARRSLAPQQPRKTITISPVKASNQSARPPKMLMPGKMPRSSIALSAASRPLPLPSAFSSNTGNSSMSTMRPPASTFRKTLVSLDERESTSSPESGSAASRSSGLGSASRVPLNERSAVPGANTSLTIGGNGNTSPSGISGLPGVFSNLSRPTQSSLGKATGGLPKRISLANMGNGMPSSVSMSDRRSSSTGPIRTERHKIRPSVGPIAGVRHPVPGGANESISGASRFGLATITASPRPGPGLYGSTASSPSPNSSPLGPPPAKSAYNPLGGGATRLTQPTAASLARRTSTMGLASAAAAGNTSMAGNSSMSMGPPQRGPRPSVSIAQLRQQPRTSILPPQGGSRFR